MSECTKWKNTRRRRNRWWCEINLCLCNKVGTSTSPIATPNAPIFLNFTVCECCVSIKCLKFQNTRIANFRSVSPRLIHSVTSLVQSLDERTTRFCRYNHAQQRDCRKKEFDICSETFGRVRNILGCKREILSGSSARYRTIVNRGNFSDRTDDRRVEFITHTTTIGPRAPRPEIPKSFCTA